MDADGGGQDRIPRPRVAAPVPVGQDAARAQPGARAHAGRARYGRIRARTSQPRAGGVIAMNVETRSERLSHLDWPFLEDQHRTLARALDAWATEHVAHSHDGNVDAECRALVRSLGDAGWLCHAVGGTGFGGAADVIDT